MGEFEELDASQIEIRVSDEVIRKLEAFPSLVREAHADLQSSPEKYLSNVLGLDDPRLVHKVDDKMRDFTPLRKAQLKYLLECSDRLGLPLSPIGEMTFTPDSLAGVLRVLRQEDVITGNNMDLAGATLDNSVFRGIHKELGFWMVQSATAYTINSDPKLKAIYSLAHDTKIAEKSDDPDEELTEIINSKRRASDNKNFLELLNTPAPYGRAPLAPDKVDVSLLHSSMNHEAAHSSMGYFNHELDNTASFESVVMSELLAHRIENIMEGIGITNIIDTLMQEYDLTAFGELNQSRIDLINSLAKRIFNPEEDEMGIEIGTKSEYQANISAIAMVSKSISDFEEMCVRVIDNQEMVSEIEDIKKAAKETIAKMRADLL